MIELTMSKRLVKKDRGLPILVLDVRDVPKVPDSPKIHYRTPGRINLSAIKMQQYHNRNLPRPNRYFPSIFGPGGGYADSSWI